MNYAEMSAGEIARALEGRFAELRRGPLPDPAPAAEPPSAPRGDSEAVRRARADLEAVAASARRQAESAVGRSEERPSLDGLREAAPAAPDALTLIADQLGRAAEALGKIAYELGVLSEALGGSLDGVEPDLARVVAETGQKPPAASYGDPGADLEQPKPKPGVKPWQKIGVSLNTYKRLQRRGLLKDG